MTAYDRLYAIHIFPSHIVENESPSFAFGFISIMLTSFYLLCLSPLLFPDLCRANDPVLESLRLSSEIGKHHVASKTGKTILEK